MRKKLILISGSPCLGDIVVDTDNKSIREIVKEMKREIAG